MAWQCVAPALLVPGLPSISVEGGPLACLDLPACPASRFGFPLCGVAQGTHAHHPLCMAITQRGRGYQVSLSKDGKRHRKLFSSLSEAELAEAEGRAALLRGEDPFPHSGFFGSPEKPSTVQQLFELTYRARWAGSKGERTAIINGKHVVEALGPETRVSDIDQALVNEVHRKIRTGYAGATVNRKLATLSAMLTLAEEEGLITDRPKVPREKEGPHRTRYLTQAEEAQLLDNIESPHLKSLFVFLAETGLRLGEAFALRWQDLHDGYVSVRDSKGGTARKLPLTDRALSATEDAREYSGMHVGPWEEITQGAVTHYWNKAKSLVASLSGDREVVPHCLRHTCASRLMQGGVDILTVQKWLGHASLRMTLIYAHLAPDQLIQARNTLQRLHGNASKRLPGETPADNTGSHAPTVG